ncbi:MAG: histidine kinase [Bacteroidales bacterium]|nr:MAG: histidine kinase [Bacteroidales bacterium]
MHPILKNFRTISYFVLAWILVTAIHVSILAIFYQALNIQALADGIIFNLLLAIIALGLWYPVRFMQSEERNTLILGINHIGIAFLSITLWLTVGYFVLESMFRNDTEFLNFLDQSMPWRIASGVLLYLIILLVYYLILYYSNLQEKIRMEGELKALVKESELNMLKSQINPHFLFNSLNSINALILADHQKAQNMIIRLSEFLRYALKYHQKDKTRLREEIYNMNLYLDIEKIRFGEKLVIENEVPEAYGKCFLPNMILQPLIENAIKHGVYESTEAVSIVLECFREGDFLVISIRNTFDPDQPGKKGNGMGLKNVQNRLKLIYNRSDLFSYHKENNIFITELRIPFEV